MSIFAALAGSVLRHKRQLSVPALALAILAFGLIPLPADRAVAYQDPGAPPCIGSINDYMRQGQSRDQGTDHKRRIWAREARDSMARRPALAHK